MTYYLSGYLSFRPSGACFLIPYYSAKGSNLTYAHEVDERGRVEFFYEISPANYHQELNIPLGIQLNNDDPAHFAVRLIDDTIMSGDATTLSNLLKEVDLSKLGSPFFNVDAYTFVGNATKRRKAVKLAASLFGNPKVAASWRERELRVATLGLRRPSSATPLGQSEKNKIKNLTDSFSAKEWSKDWADVWHSTRDEQGRLILQDLAFVWLGSLWERHKPNLVLTPLLMRPATRDRAFALTDTDFNSNLNNALWFDIWRAMVAAARKTAPEMLPRLNFYGLDYLKHEWVEPKKGGIRRWSKVFRILSDGLGITDEMAEIAFKVSPLYWNDPHFQKNVLYLAFADFDNFNRFHSERTRFLELIDVSNFWISIFNLTRQPSKIAVSKAIEYLEHGQPMLINWPSLWRSCGTYLTSSEHQNIGANWLKKGTSVMRAWPDVLLSLGENQLRDPEIHELVEKWLDSNVGHSLYEQVLTRHLTLQNPSFRAIPRQLSQSAVDIFNSKIALAIRQHLAEETPMLINEYKHTSLSPQIIFCLEQIRISLFRVEDLSILINNINMLSILIKRVHAELPTNLISSSNNFIKSAYSYTILFPHF